MNGLARVVLVGNLTRDPELRTTSSDLSICSLSIACNERVKKGGDWTDYVSFFDAVVFGKSAENTAQFLSKGSPVVIDGKLRQDRWEKDGQKRSRVEVIADSVTFVPDGQKREQSLGSSGPSTADPEEGPIPFRTPRIPDRNTRWRDLFVGDR